VVIAAVAGGVLLRRRRQQRRGKDGALRGKLPSAVLDEHGIAAAGGGDVAENPLRKALPTASAAAIASGDDRGTSSRLVFSPLAAAGTGGGGGGGGGADSARLSALASYGSTRGVVAASGALAAAGGAAAAGRRARAPARTPIAGGETAAGEEAPLAEGWTAVWSNSRQRYYYRNESGETSWNRPEGGEGDGGEAAQPSTASEALPAGWTSSVDETSGATFFIAPDGSSQWHAP